MELDKTILFNIIKPDFQNITILLKRSTFSTVTVTVLFVLQVTPVYGTVTVYASRVTRTPGPDNYSLIVEPQGMANSSDNH